MSDRDMLSAGILSTVAAALLLTASAAFPADKPSLSGGSVELKPKAMAHDKLNLKELDEEVSHLEVIDSKGNAYLLIPLKTTSGNRSVVAEDGKIIVEYVHPYAGRLGN